MLAQLGLVLALLVGSVVQGQQVSPCPVQTNVHNRLHPNGVQGVNYVQGFNLYNKQEIDVVAASPINGGGCNLTSIDLKDFVNSIQSDFCKNPSNTAPTSTPANLAVTPTSSELFAGEPSFQLGNTGGSGSAAGRRLQANFQCGNRSPFASQILNGGFKKSQQYANTFYSILKGAPGSPVAGTTYFGIGVDGKCFINYINMDKWLFQNAQSPAGICSIAKVNGAQG